MLTCVLLQFNERTCTRASSRAVRHLRQLPQSYGWGAVSQWLCREVLAIFAISTSALRRLLPRATMLFLEMAFTTPQIRRSKNGCVCSERVCCYPGTHTVRLRWHCSPSTGAYWLCNYEAIRQLPAAFCLRRKAASNPQPVKPVSPANSSAISAVTSTCVAASTASSAATSASNAPSSLSPSLSPHSG